MRPDVHATRFRTRQVADPPRFVRTVGMVARLAGGIDGFDAAEALSFLRPADTLGSARGKVVALGDAGSCWDVICYQTHDDGRGADVVACGNGTAAAALLVRGEGSEPVRLRVRLPGAATVLATVAFPGPAAVAQTWHKVPFTWHEEARGQTRGEDRVYAVTTGALNDYLVVALGAGERVDDVTVAEAMDWARAFGVMRDPLRARVCVLARVPGECPRVRFFTCGEREHPSAPLTGLAVLALASAAGLLPPWAQASAVTTALGRMPLPALDAVGGGEADIIFPAVVVELDPSR